jgi:tight adherence protein B
MSLDEIDPIYLFLVSLAIAVVLVVEAIYLTVYKAQSYRSNVNRRLVVQGKERDREAALVQLRKERGLSAAGGYDMALKSLNLLLIQSGLNLRLWQLLGFAAAASGLAGTGVYFGIGKLPHAVAVGLVMAILAPWLVLTFIRNRRRNAFGSTFPEAIDIIVRSLRAGHPVTVALNMVAREMPDPVGSEFGIVADEVSFGSDLESAMRGMMMRVGQEDLPLFVTSVSIQSSTGGNLAEILQNLSTVIRERFKMRRKIRALSSEGKASAIILGATPIILFTVVNWTTPSFYGEVWDHPWTINGLIGAGFWMFIGIMVMRRMINFRF